MSDIKTIVKEVFDESIKGVSENLTTQYKELGDKMGNLTDDVARMKIASQLVDQKTGVSHDSKEALGNTVKFIFGAKVGEKATLLKNFVPTGMRQKADAFISGSDAGYGQGLMGTEVYKGIIRIATEFGHIMAMSETRTTTQRTYKLVIDGGSTTNYGGYDDELTKRDAEKLAFTPVEVTLKKWRRIIGTSQEAIEDSEPEELGAYIITVLAESFGIHTDVKGFELLLGNANAPVLTTASNTAMTWEEVVNCQGLPKKRVLSRSAYFVNMTTYLKWVTIKDADGNPLIRDANKNVIDVVNFAGGVGITPAGMIGRYPIYVVEDEVIGGNIGDVTGTDIGIFGDVYSAMALITRRSFAVEESTEERFSEDIVLVKGSARKIEVVKNDNAYCVITLG